VRRSARGRIPRGYDRSVKPLVLEVLEGEDAGLQVDLTGPVEVGREAGLGLALADSTVDPRHASITVEHGEATVEDLGSSAGTYVNELQVIGRARIRPGDRIRFGMTVVELVTSTQASADRRRPKPPPVPELSPVELEHAPEGQLAAGSEPPLVGPLRTDETTPAFVTADVQAPARPQDRYGALTAWTDSRVKHQTRLAAFGLLAVAALAVLLVFFN
jgi:pSer/pThr/pTyr-binding forkhead associated (FHA) protein